MATGMAAAVGMRGSDPAPPDIRPAARPSVATIPAAKAAMAVRIDAGYGPIGRRGSVSQ